MKSKEVGTWYYLYFDEEDGSILETGDITKPRNAVFRWAEVHYDWLEKEFKPKSLRGILKRSLREVVDEYAKMMR